MEGLGSDIWAKRSHISGGCNESLFLTLCWNWSLCSSYCSFLEVLASNLSNPEPNQDQFSNAARVEREVFSNYIRIIILLFFDALFRFLYFNQLYSLLT
jgi:hypothetical protein